MKYSYYPGCTLKTKAKELNDYAIRSAKVLGIEMEEIENWQCCGGVYTAAKDEIATKLSSIRALAQARDKGQDLLTLCSACHNVIKRTNTDIQTDEDFSFKANNYMAPDMEYHGETKVVHYFEVLRDVVGFDTLKSKVVNPLRAEKSRHIMDVFCFGRVRSWRLTTLRIRRLWRTLSVRLVRSL